ncbi:MAG: glycosyltransferase family 4 protein [Proteobacteria bacterium]|nr:glycosyltransferase family 4 protein [Pseudomonadota bacterium]
MGLIGEKASESAPSTRPLSVLVVNSLYAPFVVGGAEIVTEMLATTLAVHGHRTVVVTSCSRDEDVRIERRDGVDIYRFFPKNRWWLYERFAPGDKRSAVDKLRWRVTDAWNRDAGDRFSEILDRIQPDVVHTHNIKGFSPAIWHVARRRGVPVVHTAHSYELICADGSLLDRNGESCAAQSRCMGCKFHGAWYRAQAEAIDVFCSPSEYLLQAHAEAGVMPRRSAHVRNGVARLGSLSNIGRRSGDHSVRFLYMGQLSTHKGIDTLIQAIRIVKNPAFAIDIAGRGDGEAKLEALANVDDRVRFHGFVEGERKDQLIAGADALVFPSIWVENSPMSIAEAFCYGLPVIGSRIGAIPEFVEHGSNGLLFEPGNATGLAACMTDLLERPDELGRMKENARQSGNSWPTPEIMASEYVSIYRSLLRRRRD